MLHPNPNWAIVVLDWSGMHFHAGKKLYEMPYWANIAMPPPMPPQVKACIHPSIHVLRQAGTRHAGMVEDRQGRRQAGTRHAGMVRQAG